MVSRGKRKDAFVSVTSHSEMRPIDQSGAPFTNA